MKSPLPSAWSLAAPGTVSQLMKFSPSRPARSATRPNAPATAGSTADTAATKIGNDIGGCRNAWTTPSLAKMTQPNPDKKGNAIPAVAFTAVWR